LWQKTADHLWDIKPVATFSPKSCKKRFEGLEAGTAAPTPESLENPSEEMLALIIRRQVAEAQIAQDAQGMEIAPGVFSAPSARFREEA
jgi:hypothetical protein